MALAMHSSASKLSYQRLKQEIYIDENDKIWEEVIGKSLRRSRFRKLHIKRKLRVKLKIPGIKRLLRKKVSLVKFAWNKVCKRLKESQAHFSHLFAGNYLFMQVM
ncbi:hypothetical protein CASFOL_018947 [Castilleja foliolosa]|uniref:Uncharacterized protein n=1 Tax=Castilleja foliolosa TaxID=1961234 RepID=A0ABD3D3Q7_9LAMI